MSDRKIKVLYIGGWGRSGSTILARILGQIEGFFHGGELRTIWLDGLKPKNICGCGVLVRECPVWTAIFQRAFDGIDRIDPQAMTQLRCSSEPQTKEVCLATLQEKTRSRLQSRLTQYQQVLSALYHGIQDVTKSRAIVDDSLHPGYAYTLATLPEIDFYLLHLVRDPRGTAYSWLKPSQYLGNYSLRDNALGWNMRNLALELLKRHLSTKYLRLSYEDFSTHPQRSLRAILNLLDEDASTLPFLSDREVQLGITHSVFGNPNRKKTGMITIQKDEEWKQKLKRRDQLAIASLTFPLLLKYGYSIK
ncbi:MAG: sulfotransferase [Spirulina sp.]